MELEPNIPPGDQVMGSYVGNAFIVLISGACDPGSRKARHGTGIGFLLRCDFIRFFLTIVSGSVIIHVMFSRDKIDQNKGVHAT